MTVTGKTRRDLFCLRKEEPASTWMSDTLLYVHAIRQHTHEGHRAHIMGTGILSQLRVDMETFTPVQYGRTVTRSNFWINVRGQYDSSQQWSVEA